MKVLKNRDSWLLCLHRDQSGASYSLSVLITIPLLIVYLLATIETTLLFNSHLSLTAASQVAGRTAKAWWLHRQAMENESIDLEQMVLRTTSRNRMGYTATSSNDSRVPDVLIEQELLELGLSELASQRYGKKVSFLSDMTRVIVSPEQRSTKGVLVRLEYDSPLWFPLLASLLATGKNAHGYFRTISTEVWVPIAEHEFALTNTGIPYSPIAATEWPID